MTDPPSPPSKTCAQCKGWALKTLDPDGVGRCFGHSTHPLNVAKREALAATGRAAGERQRGVKQADRGAVQAGVVPIEEARAKAREAKARDEADPIPLDSRQAVLDFLGAAAGKLAVGALEAAEANASASLARVALAALGADLPDDNEDADEAPRGFTYQTTEGDPVRVRGRDDGVH